MTTDRLAPGNVLPTAVMPMNTAVFDGICDKALICDDVATAAVWPAGIVSVSRSSLFWLFPDDGQHFHYAFSHRSSGIYGSVADHSESNRTTSANSAFPVNLTIGSHDAYHRRGSFFL